MSVVLVAAVVFGGVLWSSQRADDASVAAMSAVTVNAAHPVVLQGGAVVVAGRSGAPHTLDLYEDALCPACKAFEAQAGSQIQGALDAGRLLVRYHPVNLLEQRSNPPGYSTAGGNAMLCAAENGAFPSVHASLYDAQPEEGAAGYTTEQLVSLGQRVGAGPGYGPCITGGAHAGAVADNYDRASSDPTLTRTGDGSTGFSTPTIVLDGRVVSSAADLRPALG